MSNSSNSEKMKEKSKNEKNLKKTKTLIANEVQQYYNRDVWFVTSNAAKSKIESRIKQLEKISTEILTNSDIANEEKEAHKYLCEVLRKVGCDVHHHYIHPTAFKAVFQSSCLSDDTNAPTIGLICEYDAVKEFGHSNGNNLLTEATIATLIGIREAMNSDTRLVGRVMVLGTPASEENGGKILMMKEGVFDKLDIILAVKPSNQNCLFPRFYCYQKIKITFEGRIRHIDCSNIYQNKNTLDAALLCRLNILSLSNQMKANVLIHCIIKKSEVDYLVPKKSEVVVCIKTEDLESLDSIGRRVVDCSESAANTTQTKVQFNFFDDNMYSYLNHNKVLANLFKEESKSLGIDFKEEEVNNPLIYKSTDLGNISHKVPLIYPTFSIGNNIPPVHTKDFTSALTRAEAQTNTIKISIAMTFTIIKYLLNPSLQNEIRLQFERQKNIQNNKITQNKTH